MAERPIDELKENKEPEQKSPKTRKGKKGLILLIGGLLFLILAAMGAIFLFAPSLIPAGINPSPKETSTEEKKSKPAEQGHIYSLDAMIVNLADTDLPRYLRIKIDIESESPKPDGEFDKRLAQIKDAILTILTSKTYSEISDSKGKGRLKEEIVLKANQLFETFKVKTVYFTEFVVQ